MSGESAGASLAIAAVMVLKKTDENLPAGIVTLSPFIDCTLSRADVSQNDGEDPIVEQDTLAYMVSSYFQDHDPKDPLVSPIFGDLTGFPPLLVQAGKKEVLVDHAISLAKKAKEFKVDVTLELYDERLHIFSMFPYLPNAENALRSVEKFIIGRN